VFLGHARLYVLGDKYGIEALTPPALQKLHRTLINFRVYESRIPDIVELVRYTYQNTPGEKDPLTALVTEYIACEIDKVGKCEDFHTLLEDGGGFVVVFWRYTQKHLL
jgi:hypothetical protein